MISWLKSGGWFRGFRSLVHHTVALAQTRLELLSIELQIERQRLLTALLLIAGVAVFGFLMLAIFMVGLLELAWDTGWRRPVIWLIFGVFLSLCAGMLFSVIRMIKRSPRPFSGTLRELRKDSEVLKAMKK